MTRTLITGGRSGPIAVVDGTIAESADGPLPDRVIDAGGLHAAPGFVDLQINGGFGIDLASDPEAMWDLGRLLPRHGVTAFLPTIISSPAPVRDAALAALGQRPAGYVGAEPLGVHFEGPMLSPHRPGAHPVQHFVAPSLEVVDGWSRDAGVVLVTLAPELPGADQVIAELAGRDVVIAAGHSDADAPAAERALESGVTMVTHLFNAMAPFAHRAPGLAGVALARPDVTAGLIADGVHVDPVSVAAAWAAKGPAGIALVTDAVAPMGLEPGRYGLGAATVIADDRSVRTPDGTLAGSLLTMDQAVRNIVAETGCPLSDACTAAATTPADVLGERRRGRLEPGAVADLVLLDDALEVAITLCAGEVAHVAPSAAGRIDSRPGAG